MSEQKEKPKYRITSVMITLVIAALILAVVQHNSVSSGDTSIKPLLRKQVEVSPLFKVTGYCDGPCCCGKYADGITASGHVIKKGDKIAAAPKSIPFGTIIVVDGHGEYVIKDRGGAIKDGCFDLLFDSHQDALNFGVQYLEVVIK